jgi:hypothetical protein
LESSFGALVERAIEQVGLGELVKTIKLHSPIEIERLAGKRRSKCC